MVSRFHLICSVHKLTGCNLKFNMEKAYNKGSHSLRDEIVYNPSYGPCHVLESYTVKWGWKPIFVSMRGFWSKNLTWRSVCVCVQTLPLDSLSCLKSISFPLYGIEWWLFHCSTLLSLSDMKEWIKWCPHFPQRLLYPLLSAWMHNGAHTFCMSISFLLIAVLSETFIRLYLWLPEQRLKHETGNQWRVVITVNLTELFWHVLVFGGEDRRVFQHQR